MPAHASGPGAPPEALMKIAPQVAEAIASGGPIVALETTVVTHGLPHPQGLEAAAEMEKAIRAAGAIPATIGIGQGQVRVGMTAEELRHLAASPDILKVNPGNLASTVASGRAGSTT